jgi:putative SOS response-associated peptidase YedK
MCGRFAYKLTWPEIATLYRLTLDQPPRNTQPRYNVCPTDPVDVASQPSCLHGGDDDNFARRFKTILPFICPKLALNLLPRFSARRLVQRGEHLMQSTERLTLEARAFPC